MFVATILQKAGYAVLSLMLGGEPLSIAARVLKVWGTSTVLRQY